MKYIVALLMVLSIASFAYADAALTWDKNPTAELVDMYQVEITNSDGQIVANPQLDINAYVVINLPDGEYTSRIRAHNMVGWNDYSMIFKWKLPVVFKVPSEVSGQKIIDYTPSNPW